MELCLEEIQKYLGLYRNYWIRINNSKTQKENENTTTARYTYL